MFTKKSPGLSAVIVALALAAILMAGCSSSSKKSESPINNNTLTLNVSPTVVKTGHTSVVEVTIANGGVGTADQVVTFTVSPADVGSFNPASDTTDANGVAATVFTATKSGSANITAAVTGSTLTKSVGVSIEQSQQGTNSGNVTMAVTPTLIRANGVDSSTVTVTVKDALGHAAPESTLVKFVAGEKFADIDGNGYWTAGVDTMIYDANSNSTWDALGLIQSTAYTNASGVVTVKYYAGNDAFTVYVKATINDKDITGFAEVPLQLTPNATINAIYLSSDSMNLSVKQTGGIETGIIRAIGYDFNGNTVPEGLVISFFILDAPERNGYANARLGNVGYGPYLGVTNSQGVATATVHSGQVAGTIKIRATADTVLSNATQVMVSAGPPAHIVVGSDTCNVPYWFTVGKTNGILAVVSDQYLNPVNDSTVVYFSCDEGTMKSHEARTMQHEGIAGTKWFSGNNVDSADGIVKIFAETDGGNVRCSSFFYNTGYCIRVPVLSYPDSVWADGKSKFNVYVEGYDLNLHPMVSGTPVATQAQFLQTSSGSLTDGCNTSMAVIELQSATLDADYSLTGGGDNGVGAIDHVTFRVGFADSTVAIVLKTGFASRSLSIINCPASVDTGQVVDISVTIKDRWSNPLGDHTLVMSASGGTVLSSTHVTDGYGEAYGFRYRAPGTKGTQSIVVDDLDPRGGGLKLTASITVNAP